MHDSSIYEGMTTALHARKWSNVKQASSRCELIAVGVPRCLNR